MKSMRLFTHGNKKRRKGFGRRLVPAVVAALVLLCAGCDAGPDDSLFPAYTRSSVGGPVKGGTLTVPIPENAGNLNPLTETSRDIRSLAGLIFEPLVSFDDGGEPVSCLAQSWQVDESGLVWTFSLREGVVWHGLSRDMTADDVVFTLDLIREMGEDSPYGSLLNYVDSWQATDPYSIALTMKQPFYGVVNALNFPIVPRNCGYGADSAPELPIGTGPYRATAGGAGQGMSLTVNEQWWKKAPYIEKVEAVPFSGDSEALSALVLQQLDVMQNDSVTAAQYRDSGDANGYEYTTPYFEFLAPNFNSLYLQDARVRKAIAYALNRDEIVSNVYVNQAIVVDAPISPASWLYSGRLVVYNQDLDEAGRLLKLAGWKDSDGDGWLDTSPSGVQDSLSLTLLTYDDPDQSLRYDAARIIESQLAEAGIKVNIRSETWDVFTQMMEDGNYDLLLAGWYLSDIPDFTFAFGSEGSGNVSGYKSEAMDALLAQALEQSTAEGLQQVTDQIYQLVVEDLPVISLYFRTHVLLTTLPVQGVKHVREDNAYIGIADWYIDPGLLS